MGGSIKVVFTQHTNYKVSTCPITGHWYGTEKKNMYFYKFQERHCIKFEVQCVFSCLVS